MVFISALSKKKELIEKEYEISFPTNPNFL